MAYNYKYIYIDYIYICKYKWWIFYIAIKLDSNNGILAMKNGVFTIKHAVIAFKKKLQMIYIYIHTY
jgi:hypothetical protein